MYLFIIKTSRYMVVEKDILDIWHKKNTNSEWFTYLSFKLIIIWLLGRVI